MIVECLTLLVQGRVCRCRSEAVGCIRRRWNHGIPLHLCLTLCSIGCRRLNLFTVFLLLPVSCFLGFVIATCALYVFICFGGLLILCVMVLSADNGSVKCKMSGCFHCQFVLHYHADTMFSSSLANHISTNGSNPESHYSDCRTNGHRTQDIALSSVVSGPKLFQMLLNNGSFLPCIVYRWSGHSDPNSRNSKSERYSYA